MSHNNKNIITTLDRFVEPCLFFHENFNGAIFSCVACLDDHALTSSTLMISQEISKPLGIGDLEGVYSDVYEEVDIKTFVDKLLLEKLSDVYIISAITGSDKESELIQSLNSDIEGSKVNYLKSRIGVLNQQNIMRPINQRIQIAHDQFKVKTLNKYATTMLKEIYWIILENGGDKSTGCPPSVCLLCISCIVAARKKSFNKR
ncbi:hypothetical protein ABEB36_003122 [Hypothenemus hampei]|uniref:Uncharacterized protein n=1 Tax=Hypothenemus hampei TaxID=57062 RepID=A0ABD1F845_HYPHA